MKLHSVGFFAVKLVALRLLTNGFKGLHTIILAVLLVGLHVYTVDRVGAQTSGTWTNTGSLNFARVGHTATILSNGQVLVAGGENTTGVLDSAIRLVVAANKLLT